MTRAANELGQRIRVSRKLVEKRLCDIDFSKKLLDRGLLVS